MLKSNFRKKLGTGLLAMTLLLGVTGSMALTNKPVKASATALSCSYCGNGITTYGMVYEGSGLKVYSTAMVGTYSADVKEIQNMLKQLQSSTLVADGYYGINTANVAKAWQTRHHITSDGMVGSQTLHLLNTHSVNFTYN